MTLNRHALPRLLKLGVGAGLLATGLGLGGMAAYADPGAVGEMPVAGTQLPGDINGQPVTYTLTAGSAHTVYQFHQDATGIGHFTGTISLTGVTATNGSSDTVYRVVGASWFGGNGASQATTTVRATDEFNIIGPAGKVASVHDSLTFYPNGTVKGNAIGDCQAPM